MVERPASHVGQPGRKRLSAAMADPFVHASAVVDAGASIGTETKVWHFCHIMSGAQVGTDCVLGQNVMVGPGVRIGNGVKVQNNVSLYTGTTIEDDVFLGPSCVLTNVVNPRSHVSRKHESKSTLLRRGATIGANATVVCGTEIGRYAFVGAGAVVTRDVPAFAQVVGTPARIVAWRCQCGERLPLAVDAVDSDAACEHCGASYRWSDEETLAWSNEEELRCPP